MAYSIGKMRHKVEIQAPVNTTDTGGGSARTWSTVNTRFANVRPVKGVEGYRQGQGQETLSYEVVMRHTDDIGTNYRLKFGSKILNIKHLRNENQRDKYTILQCDEGVAI